MKTFYSFYLRHWRCVIMLLGMVSLQQVASAQTSNDSLAYKYADTLATQVGHPGYYLASFKLPYKTTGNIVRQLNEHSAITRISNSRQYDSLGKIASLVVANDQWKLSPALESRRLKNRAAQKFILVARRLSALLFLLEKMDKDVEILDVNQPTSAVVLKTNLTFILENILPLQEVLFIDLQQSALPETKIIGYDRSLHGINAVDYLIPGANGNNIVAGVKEQRMDERDIDLWKRVLPSPIAAANTSFHATVIATIIGGAGNSFYDGRGIAWGCKFFPSTFDNLFPDDAAILNANMVSVQNHSYGTIIQQFYGAEAAGYDLITWQNKSFVPVFSAGNQGESAATEGRYRNIPGFANLTGNFKMAKNVITVGAIDNAGNISTLSSAGPLYDGRIAPLLTALGPGGTSDAAAIVSGTAAVLQQVYKDSNGVLPQASLTKAILLNTAEDIGRPGIDFKTGYGLLDSYAAVKSMQQKKYDAGSVTNGGQWTKNFSVPAGIAELNVTLAWTDTAALVNNNKALTNDLDLELLQVASGAVYQPWVLSAAPNADSLRKEPIRKRDSLNTAEQVSLKLPAAGIYQLRVKGTGISSVSVPFHIAIRTDTLNTFYFTNPLHASDVIREDNSILTVRWKTFVSDTSQTGTLSISYNNGGSWQVLGQPRLYRKQFAWPIKDTTAVALLRMQTAFGDFLSASFILAPLTRLKVDFFCSDSFRLSWNRQMNANAYRVYMLTDSPYLKPFRQVIDTFIVLQRAAFPSTVYAVEPILNGGSPSARSAALDVSKQSVNCFYKTLNYDLLDTNTLKLILDLSIAEYVDSVYFEKVTANGQFLQNYGSMKVVDPNLVYTQLLYDLPIGITYVRARIKLRNGAIVYTDILSVLTSGSQRIYFYPNPVRRNVILNYSLQQGIPTSSRLQLYDIYGRLLRSYADMPGTVNVSRFPPGVIIYKILTAENKVLETGKILVL